MTPNKPRVWFERPILSEVADFVAERVTALGPPVTDRFDGLTEAMGAVVAVSDYDAAFMDHGPRLLVIARTGIGVDTVDVPEATRRGIAVCNAPDGPTVSTAEHAVMLLMMAAKNAVVSVRDLRAGGENFYARNKAIELAGKTMGLVGFGRIARRVATMTAAIGMDVLVHDPFVPADAFPETVERVDDLFELLGRSDAISAHIPLTQGTRHLFDSDAFAAMRPNAVFVNTARGGLVDQEALVAAIDGGHLFGAGLDVTEPEPLPPDHPLLNRDNIVVTPHVASGTGQGKRNNFTMALEQVIQVAYGERPAGLVNPDVWDSVLARMEDHA